MLSGKRATFTVVHRSGDTTNRFGPNFAALLVQVGLLRVKSASLFVKLRYTPPPFPVAPSPEGAAHDENDVFVTFNMSPVAPPITVPLSPPPQLPVPFTLLFVKMHKESSTTEDEPPP
jgi:hypothetical protein